MIKFVINGHDLGDSCGFRDESACFRDGEGAWYKVGEK